MCLILYFWAKAQRNGGQKKTKRKEVDTIMSNVQERIAKANGAAIEHYSLDNITAPGGLRDIQYQNADFINKHCTRLEDFVINDEITGFDLLKLAELNGIDLQIMAGWYPLVIELVNELYKNGWDKKVSCIKEKYAGLRFHASVLDAGGDDITEKYERKSERVCETCGEEGRIRSDSGWDYVACHKHYMEDRGRITVQDGGFTFNAKPYTWADVKDMRFEDQNSDKRYKFIVIECHKSIVNHAGWTDNKMYIKKSTIGYGNFLNHINNQYRSLSSSYIENFANVEFCEICGYKAVYFGTCECCENKDYKAYKDSYGSNIDEMPQEYIMREQLEWTAVGGEGYEQEHKTYIKNPEYIILYTPQELEAYKADTYWDEEL
ncbi:MAG: hypothetical protein V4581_08720 [Bacteroidota bacterium]